MYRVIIWGAGREYAKVAYRIEEARLKGQLEVVGISANSLPSEGWVNGYPIMAKSDTTSLDFDYLILCMGESIIDEGMREAIEEYGVPREKIIRSFVFETFLFDFDDYIELRNSNISIIADLCWGGLACRSLDMKCLSPFRNLFILKKDYFRLLSDLRGYCSLDELSFVEYYTDNNNGARWPVMALGDVNLHFNHVETPEQAVQQWFARRDRINWDNLFVMTACYNREQELAFHAFDQYEKKVCFVPYESDLPCSFHLYQRPSEKQFFDTVNGTAYRGSWTYPLDIIHLLLGRGVL